MSQGQTSREINVALLWHSPNSGNLGVGALTVANLALARAAAIEAGLVPRFQIVSMRDEGISYLHADEANVFAVNAASMVNPNGYWKVIGDQDCALDIGAGDSFTDIYSSKRFIFLWLSKFMAHLRGVPLMFSPQTIGPFTRSPYKQLARIALERADMVVVRDPMSLDAVRSLSPRANATQSIDVAFALPFEDRSSLRGAKRTRVGVNVSGLLFQEATTGINRFGLDVNYAELMERFIGQLAIRDDVEVHLITHANSNTMPEDDDGLVADALSARFPQVVRVPDFANPSEAKSYISGLDFLVAGRMHACIAAISSGTPVVPIAYSRKFIGLFGQLNYQWIVPVKGLNTDQALEFLNKCLKNRVDLANDAKSSMAEVSDLLGVYTKELTRFFLTSLRSKRGA